MEKKLTFIKDHFVTKITEELFAAFPEWVFVDPSALYPRTALATVSGDGNTLVLWVPKDTDEAKVAAVVASHNPAPPVPKPSAKDLARTGIRAASNIGELKAAVEKILDL